MIIKLLFSLIFVFIVGSTFLNAQNVQYKTPTYQLKNLKKSDIAILSDLTLSHHIFVSGIKTDPSKGIINVTSNQSINMDNGKCAIRISYELFNKSPININQGFKSILRTTPTSSSTYNIYEFNAYEKKVVDSSVWLVPGKLTKATIFVDNENKIKESSEFNNTKEITLYLRGSCKKKIKLKEAGSREKPTKYKVGSSNVKFQKPTTQKKDKGKKVSNMDTSSQVTRFNEAAIVAIEGLTKPDLYVTMSDPFKGNIQVGNNGYVKTEKKSSLSLSCEYKNLNGQSAGCTGLTLPQNIEIKKLEKKAKQEINITSIDTTQLEPGTYTLLATEDPGNKLDESNEQNNVATSSIYIDPPPPPPPISGKDLYEANCNFCHENPGSGAPQFGDSDEWNKRKNNRGGINGLLGSALNGYKGMPSFKNSFTPEELTEAIIHLCSCQ